MSTYLTGNHLPGQRFESLDWDIGQKSSQDFHTARLGNKSTTIIRTTSYSMGYQTSKSCPDIRAQPSDPQLENSSRNRSPVLQKEPPKNIPSSRCSSFAFLFGFSLLHFCRKLLLKFRPILPIFATFRLSDAARLPGTLALVSSVLGRPRLWRRVRRY